MGWMLLGVMSVHGCADAAQDEGAASMPGDIAVRESALEEVVVEASRDDGPPPRRRNELSGEGGGPGGAELGGEGGGGDPADKYVECRDKLVACNAESRAIYDNCLQIPVKQEVCQAADKVRKDKCFAAFNACY